MLKLDLAKRKYGCLMKKFLEFKFSPDPAVLKKDVNTFIMTLDDDFATDINVIYNNGSWYAFITYWKVELFMCEKDELEVV